MHNLLPVNRKQHLIIRSKAHATSYPIQKKAIVAEPSILLRSPLPLIGV